MNGAAGNFAASARYLSSNAFKRVQEIDSLGTFNMSREVFNQSMKEQRDGVIINVGASTHWSGTALFSHSSAGKAGVEALTKVLATEWGPHGVRVVSVIPGIVTGTEGMARLSNFENTNNREKTNSSAEKEGTQA